MEKEKSASLKQTASSKLTENRIVIISQDCGPLVARAQVSEVLDYEANAMQFLINTMAVLTVMLVSFQFSLVLSRGLLSLMLRSMHRWESRIRK